MLTEFVAPGLRILILKADKLCAGLLRQAAQRILPSATVCMVTSIKAAGLVLAEERFDLLLAGVSFSDGDVLDLLSGKSRALPTFDRALVISGRREIRLLIGLKMIPAVHGVFDPTSEDSEQLETAIKLVVTGGHYWSANVLERLAAKDLTTGSLSRLLSPTEQLVLAVIGDGCDDRVAAGQLSLQPSTIHSVRRELHRKLGVQHKGELVRLAVQQGYVRFTADGVHRPGFSGLLAACRNRRPA